MTQSHTHTHTRLTALFPGLPRWAGTKKVKPILILLKQETVSGSGISWTICKSAPRSRQITTPAPHHSVFYRPDALPAAQPTASKHWRHTRSHMAGIYSDCSTREIIIITEFANCSVNSCIGIHVLRTNRPSAVRVSLPPVNTKCNCDADMTNYSVV